MFKLFLFQITIGLILYGQSNTLPVEQDTIVQIEKETKFPPFQDNQEEQDHPTEKEESKEKETEDSTPKNYHSGLPLIKMKSVGGKALWSITNIRFTVNKFIQEINQPPEICWYSWQSFHLIISRVGQSFGTYRSLL